MMRVTIGSGFITNSSSVVHYFDKALLEDPEVAAIIEAYDLQDGLLGDPIYSRSHCSSFILSEGMKQQAAAELKEALEDYSMPPVAVGKPNVMVVIFGDEYSSFASLLCEILCQAAERAGKGNLGRTEFH